MKNVIDWKNNKKKNPVWDVLSATSQRTSLSVLFVPISKVWINVMAVMAGKGNTHKKQSCESVHCGACHRQQLYIMTKWHKGGKRSVVKHQLLTGLFQDRNREKWTGFVGHKAESISVSNRGSDSTACTEGNAVGYLVCHTWLGCKSPDNELICWWMCSECKRSKQEALICLMTFEKKKIIIRCEYGCRLLEASNPRKQFLSATKRFKRDNM